VVGAHSADDWSELASLVDALLDTPPSQRAALIAELSAGDPIRRSALERLLAECGREPALFSRPAAERFAAMFDDDVAPFPESLAERYRFTRELGRGGMATVYLARDLKHARDVAVKVVHPAVASALGADRFLHEIEIVAQLNHPLIVPLYDSGEADGSLYYVMPYEAGASLRQRLANDGALPLDEVVRILRDVCEALAFAHEHGIVHRDIKPDNVLLAGRHALVTDFGVAKAATGAAAGPVKEMGIALGTPAYMAPEQIAADPRIDCRADIYSVGALAYELIAGRPPFEGASRADVLSAHVTRVPAPLTTLRAEVPEELAELVMKCLAKRPADRWQTADDLLARLASIAVPDGARSPVTVGLRRTPARVATVLGVALVAVSSIALAVSRRRVEPALLVLGQATQLTSDPGLEVQPSISPDGRSVAYAAGRSLQMRIAVRPVGGGKAVRLTADTTENQWLPRWSPDGRRILFLSRGGVFSAATSGGPAREMVASRPGVIVTSATWSPDGREIAYVRGDSLLARRVGTADVRLITTGHDLHSCRWSLDGVRLACVSGNSFYATVGPIFGRGPMFGNLAPSSIVVVPAAGGVPVSVTDSGSLHQSPVWSRDGRTLYYVSNRQGPRDVYALQVGERGSGRGEPVRVTTGIGAHSIDLSADGTRIVYAAYRSSANVWAMPIPSHPPGSPASAVPVTSGNQNAEGIRVSRDGRWVVYDSDLSGNSDVYRVPVAGGEPERLTRDPSDEFRGALSPTGKELAYHSFRTGSRNVFLARLDGGPVQQLTHSSHQLAMANWSPDGTALSLFDMTTARVLVMRRDAGGRWSAPRFVGARGWRPEWSPDGRTIAFVSPTDGRIGVVPADSGAPRDLYVPHDDDPLAELAIFAANGRELYFKSHDARGKASFWSIPAAGGRPRLLARFDDPARASNRFDFASDGKRFYFTLEDRQSDVWVAELTAR
jgi:serine/threonine protein kinase/Tol biopolymer transport system component